MPQPRVSRSKRHRANTSNEISDSPRLEKHICTRVEPLAKKIDDDSSELDKNEMDASTSTASKCLINRLE